jgi:Type I phosphodiesterase / nucleotide pyrophosphatase
MAKSGGWLTIRGAGLLPGVLAGAQVAGLLFFLNPALPFRGEPFARAVLQYGLLLGLAGLAAQLPWTRGRPQRARRLLPWTLTAALAAAALLDAAHASYYAYYLPAGVNRRLLKAALWLAVAALAGFYTALLHTLRARRYGWRSRWFLGLLAVLSVYVLIERRESFRPRPEPLRRVPVVERGERPRLWVIGLDAATLDAILPLAAQGRVPFLARLLEEGAYGRLASFTPRRPAALWTTLATGKHPARHGVLGGVRYRARFLGPDPELRLLPVGIGFERWGVRAARGEPPGAGREAATLWEVLPRLGAASAVVGWPAASAAPGLPAFVVGERELPGPGAGLAGDARRLAAAEALVARRPEVEACFVVLPGLAKVSGRAFGGWAAATFDGARGAAETRAAARLAGYYEALDARLARLWESGGGPRLLAVVSAHGVEAPGRAARLWAELTGGEGVGGRLDGAADGVLMLYGEGVRRRSLLTGARLVDLAPTLLYALRLPVARDLDGRVLTEAFDPAFLAAQPLTFLPSYEGLIERPPR